MDWRLRVLCTITDQLYVPTIIGLPGVFGDAEHLAIEPEVQELQGSFLWTR